MPISYIKSEDDNINTKNIYFNFKTNTSELGVSIITCTNRPSHINEIFKNYSRQDYDMKQLIIILNNNTMNIKKYKNKAKDFKDVKVYQLDEKTTLGDCKSFAFKKSDFEYIAFFDDDDFYAPNYLKRSLNTFNHIDCEVIGKSTFFMYFEESKTLGIYQHDKKNQENQFVNHVVDSSMIFKRKILENIKYPSTLIFQDIEFQNICLENRYRIYSTDKYNYVVHRHSNPEEQHDWVDDEYDLLLLCKSIERNIEDYTKYIIK